MMQFGGGRQAWPAHSRDGRRHRFLGRLAAPQNELEGRVIMLAGLHGEMQQSLALRRR